MTVETTNVRKEYEGDGVTTVFNFDFRVLKKTDVKLYVNDSVVSATVTLDSSGVGGYVTASSAPSDGSAVVVQRETALTQGTEFKSVGTFDPKKLNDYMDRLVLQMQEVRQQILDIDNSKLIPTPVAYEVLRGKPDASAYETVSPAEAWNDSAPEAGGGNVLGPATSIEFGVPYYTSTTGKAIDSTGVGVAGQVFKSNGPGVAPSFQSQSSFVMPSGSIMLWYGALADIPSGWHLCDGSNQTIDGGTVAIPDLRGYFVVGASNVSDPSNSGFTGQNTIGQADGSLTHNHTQQGTLNTSTAGANAKLSGSSTPFLTPEGHAHTVTLSGNTTDTSTMPKCKAYAYIIKVDE